ncbi:hypothetical protein MLGJGCBP_01256 [Rhodococcus sp. T7]|nr:hypothetical protein MLGJGCBP_09108 [Rhodococcus sp. T7]KAF0965604.1 hypothetical protein MLGJGCBP_01256 [Rhodococcus sp. T7]
MVPTAEGLPAELARHETCPLTDPTDISAHWS